MLASMFKRLLDPPLDNAAWTGLTLGSIAVVFHAAWPATKGGQRLEVLMVLGCAVAFAVYEATILNQAFCRLRPHVGPVCIGLTIALPIWMACVACPVGINGLYDESGKGPLDIGFALTFVAAGAGMAMIAWMVLESWRAAMIMFVGGAAASGLKLLLVFWSGASGLSIQSAGPPAAVLHASVMIGLLLARREILLKSELAPGVCPNCKYTLTALPFAKCPECGYLLDVPEGKAG